MILGHPCFPKHPDARTPHKSPQPSPNTSPNPQHPVPLSPSPRCPHASPISPNHSSTHPQIPQYPNRPLNPTSLTVLLQTPFPHVPQKPPPSAPRTPAPAPCITGGEGGAARDGGASKSCRCDASTCLLMRYSHAKLRGGQVSGGGGR